MRYLKPYKLFESVENKSTEVEVTINHILYELSDIGFEADCNVWKAEDNKLFFEITVSKSKEVPDGWGGSGSEATEEFNWSDIKDTMDRFCYYLFTISSNMKFEHEDTNSESHSWNFNNYNDLLIKIEEEFTEYYNKYEGWFRLGFVIELKN